MAESPAATAESSSQANTISKLSAQLKKLNEANARYKNLLKLARERIETTEQELSTVQQERTALAQRLETEETEAANRIALEETNDRDESVNIVRVCQRVKQAVNDHDEIWALLELAVDDDDKRWKEWKRFDTESELQDFIRRDTGEPIQLPPYSLSPEQSARIQHEAQQQVSTITEDFRRFRVRAELARKQADAQLRDLQSTSVQRATQRIEGQQQSQTNTNHQGQQQVEQLRAELAAQDAQWKEAYDVLLAENQALKSSGSEALLASQWRQRYEQCLQEKDDLQNRLMDKKDNHDYEQKYRDLKESFRLYRKKAKEMFESQQQHGDQANGHSTSWNRTTLAADGSSTAESKLSYLRNLMVNYLSADQAVREHMEGAIGTVLQFTPHEVERIEKKRQEQQEAWF